MFLSFYFLFVRPARPQTNTVTTWKSKIMEFQQFWMQLQPWRAPQQSAIWEEEAEERKWRMSRILGNSWLVGLLTERSANSLTHWLSLASAKPHHLAHQGQDNLPLLLLPLHPALLHTPSISFLLSTPPFSLLLPSLYSTLLSTPPFSLLPPSLHSFLLYSPLLSTPSRCLFMPIRQYCNAIALF